MNNSMIVMTMKVMPVILSMLLSPASFMSMVSAAWPVTKTLRPSG
ncbi:Uncharacterised protein [Mycobacteroides abscessus subsp. abscessus]|nr:Uncharacterised protein [Mycobacteroides abscessus]SIN58888.1 Uncharacterised protein [Mycobacteroides abscessus subsp. abscessus]SKN19962.1 Uncharacterised protein [Mycobacteroides abscessus subsp. massiliense]SKS18600.1 Uncharacterised protein [Mycobacteroides abscessus subsp. abscessus]